MEAVKDGVEAGGPFPPFLGLEFPLLSFMAIKLNRNIGISPKRFQRRWSLKFGLYVQPVVTEQQVMHNKGVNEGKVMSVSTNHEKS